MPQLPGLPLPLQTLLLVSLFSLLLPITNRMKLTYVSSEDLVIQKKDILLLIALTLLSAAVVVLYYVFVYQPKAQ